MNIIRTLDKDNILRDHNSLSSPRGLGLTQRKKELWDKILPAFNDICGVNCGLRKVQDLLGRIKNNPDCPAYAVLYGD